jgi:hypothetical protein
LLSLSFIEFVERKLVRLKRKLGIERIQCIQWIKRSLQRLECNFQRAIQRR